MFMNLYGFLSSSYGSTVLRRGTTVPILMLYMYICCTHPMCNGMEAKRLQKLRFLHS